MGQGAAVRFQAVLLLLRIPGEDCGSDDVSRGTARLASGSPAGREHQGDTMSRKPTREEVREFLCQRNALLVHFSGAPKGAGLERGAAHLFPTDLRHVVDGHASGGLSCSVVQPGDVFQGIARNATGSIGLVLDLKSADSLLAVSADDCGSVGDSSGKRNRVPRARHLGL